MTLRSIDSRTSVLVVSALIALFAALVVYGAGSYAVGEIDVAWMIAGVVHGTLAHAPLSGALHYGANFSFGDYALLYLLPPEVRADPAALARAVNLIGVVSIIAALPLTWRYLARLIGDARAALAVAVFFFSPLVLHVSGSGHPLLPAYALCMAGALALERSALAGIVLLAAALSVRAEIALLFPFLALAQPGVLRRSLSLATALALFFLAQRLALPPAHTGAGGILASVAGYYDPRALPRGVALLAWSLGLCTCIAIAASFAWRARLGRRGALLCAALIVPGLLAWLPNPQPVRHFFTVALGVALLLAWRMAAPAPRRLAVVAAGIVLANQALAEAAYPLIVRHYHWTHPTLAERRSVYWAPLGAFVRDAPARRHEQEALYHEAEEVVHAARGVPRLLVLAHNDRYLVARFIAEDPSLVPRVIERGDVSYQELESASRHIVIARLWDQRPRDTAAAILRQPDFAGWQVYGQPSTIGDLLAHAAF